MDCYNIAVIIAGIDESYQNAILKGIESFASENCINADIFVSFSGVMGNQRHDAGEFNIFNLPDFRMFDGAVLLTNTIAYEPVVSEILSRIKAAGIPAVSIDNDIPEFYHIGIDNGKAMREVTEHFIKKHGFRTFNYISGPKDNPESAARLESFMSVLRENNIPVEEDRIYYGDFRAPSGSAAFRAFLNSGLKMPQAIICANDVMAVSCMKALSSAGVRIPEDIAISGFDNIYSAQNYPVELTSVARPLKESGELACRILLNHFRGIQQERSIILDMHPKFSESCGCAPPTKGVKALKDKNYQNFAKYENASAYLSLINKMSCQLVECDSLSDYTKAMQPYIKKINAEEFYLCVCDDWDMRSEDNEPELPKFTVKGYTKTIKVPLAYRDGVFQTIPDFDSSEMLPGMFKGTGKGRVNYFIPLHFRERCLGYMIIVNSHFPLESSMFQTWCITISNMLENVRKIICLDYAVQKLDKLYTVDTLSGIYNRNGFVRGTSNLFSYCIKRKRSVMLMFIDMDGLKLINDNYGHSEGDAAIKGIALVIRESCTNGEVYCRFGGDEFIIFAADYTKDDAQRLKERIEINIDKANKLSNKEYDLSASMGYYITYPNPDDEIFQLVTAADNVMYETKKKKKLSKYLKS
ncbi:MAG: GGDEF domain-containing protein [Oscillospiraceae bacterium]|nr:GGDEF domain-containing protein [Ruminococcus sp.]MDD6097187.1 GGDEF domain-containing protein [Oscillospiraceae bacterium]